MTLDITHFYLDTLMDKPEFLRMKLDHFPQDVIDQYQLNEKVDANGTLHIRVEKGMYGLPQAGLIAQQLLEKDYAMKATRKALRHQAFGNTVGDQFVSHW